MCVRFSLTLKTCQNLFSSAQETKWFTINRILGKKGTKNENQLTDTFANRSADMQWRKLIQPIT